VQHNKGNDYILYTVSTTNKTEMLREKHKSIERKYSNQNKTKASVKYIFETETENK